MVLAILLGVVAGVIASLPMLITRSLIEKNAAPKVLLSGLGLVGPAGFSGLPGFFGTIIIGAVALIVCSQVARDVLIQFAVAEIIACVLPTWIYAFYIANSKK